MRFRLRDFCLGVMWLVLTSAVAGAHVDGRAQWLGNYVRNSVNGPTYWTVDMALSRLVPVGGSRTFEFRVEAFNVFNTFNWGNPVTNFNSGAFGRITSMFGSPRIMQFGIKYGF